MKGRRLKEKPVECPERSEMNGTERDSTDNEEELSLLKRANLGMLTVYALFLSYTYSIESNKEPVYRYTCTAGKATRLPMASEYSDMSGLILCHGRSFYSTAQQFDLELYAILIHCQYVGFM